jgi:hypothetical protein
MGDYVNVWPMNYDLISRKGVSINFSNGTRNWHSQNKLPVPGARFRYTHFTNRTKKEISDSNSLPIAFKVAANQQANTPL